MFRLKKFRRYTVSCILAPVKSILIILGSFERILGHFNLSLVYFKILVILDIWPFFTGFFKILTNDANFDIFMILGSSTWCSLVTSKELFTTKKIATDKQKIGICGRCWLLQN